MLLPREQISEKICKQIGDVYVSQVVKQVTEVPKTSSRDRTLQCTAEQILDVLVPEMAKQLVEVPESVSRDGVQQRTVEQIVDAPVPRAVEELAEVSRVFSQDRIQQRTVEQTNRAIPLAEKIVELLVIQTRQRVNACVQHVVNAVEMEKYKIIEETVQRMKPIIQEKINQTTKHIKIPQVQFLDKADDMLVDVQRQAPVAQTKQKTMEVPLSQFTGNAMDIPVVAQRQISTETVQKTREISQLKHTDHVIDVPVVSVVQVPRVCAVKKTAEIPQLPVVDVPVVVVEQVSHVHVVEKTVEDPQFQIVEKIREIPEWLNFVRENFPVYVLRETLRQNKILRVVKKTLVRSRLKTLAEIECDEGHEFMLQGNDSVCVAKDPFADVKAMTKEDLDLLCCRRSGSMRQPHRSQEQQKVQEKG